MTDRFERALPLVLKHEGGYVDHPRDPGGATNLGVTIGTARRYGLDVDDDGDVDKNDVRRFEVGDVAPVYRKGYWNKVRADELPAGLGYAVFDWAVNSGPTRAIIGLQRVVNVADDGVLGPITLAAVRSHDVRSTISRYCAERLRFKRGLSTWDVFGRGWTRRVNEVEREALKMAQEAEAFPEPVPAPRPRMLNKDMKPVAAPPAPEPEREGSGIVSLLVAIIAKLFGGRK